MDLITLSAPPQKKTRRFTLVFFSAAILGRSTDAPQHNPVMNHLRDTEIERNTAAYALVYAEDTNTLLLVHPEKALSRPHKNAPSKMTKADPKPWRAPGGKRADGETVRECAARCLREKTGLVLADIGATLVASQNAFTMKAGMLLFTVPTELLEGAGAAQRPSLELRPQREHAAAVRRRWEKARPADDRPGGDG